MIDNILVIFTTLIVHNIEILSIFHDFSCLKKKNLFRTIIIQHFKIDYILSQK